MLTYTSSYVHDTCGHTPEATEDNITSNLLRLCYPVDLAIASTSPFYSKMYLLAATRKQNP